MKVRARSSATMRVAAAASWFGGGPCIASSRSRLEGVVDDLLDRRVDGLPPGGRILHHHEKHVLSAVDHNIAPGRPVPLDLAERTGRRWHGKARIGANPETIAETEAVARIII